MLDLARRQTDGRPIGRPTCRDACHYQVAAAAAAAVSSSTDFPLIVVWSKPYSAAVHTQSLAISGAALAARQLPQLSRQRCLVQQRTVHVVRHPKAAKPVNNFTILFVSPLTLSLLLIRFISVHLRRHHIRCK